MSVQEARTAEGRSPTAGEAAAPGQPPADRSSAFLMRRADAELTAAEDKRSATVTKATAVATLAAALIAVVAAPVLDGGSLAHSASRWILLAAIVVLLGSIVCAAGALLTNAEPGDRVIREELENWTTDEFAAASIEKHERDFTTALAEGAHNVRAANERAEPWMLWSVAAVAVALVLLAVAFAVEIA
jgi:uncharacterized integral membrane protein